MATWRKEMLEHYLSICAICKNEGRYIEEWIKYHRKIGVEHFYLYENESTDHTINVLEALAARDGDITISRIAGTAKQGGAYNDCVGRRKTASRWIAFIDVDEFVVPQQTDNLTEFLKQYEKYAALCIHWRLFGSNGHKGYTPIPVVERFTYRQQDVNDHVKSIVNPLKTGIYHTPHRFYHTGVVVDEQHQQLGVTDPYPKNGTCNLIQLNHYAVKSYEECKERKSYSRADNGQCWDIDIYFPAHDRNEVEDLRALELYQA